MKYLVLIHSVLICICASTDPRIQLDEFNEYVRLQFNEFVKTYEKIYSNSSEYEQRFAIFAENLRQIELHNSQAHSWTKAVNKFADLTRNYYSK